MQAEVSKNWKNRSNLTLPVGSGKSENPFSGEPGTLPFFDTLKMCTGRGNKNFHCVYQCVFQE